jgi:hypothetical protein
MELVLHSNYGNGLLKIIFFVMLCRSVKRVQDTMFMFILLLCPGKCYEN